MAETFRLQNGELFVVASAAGGVLGGDQLRSLAALCDSETAFLKLTEDGSVGFMIDEGRLEEVRDQLRSTGLLVQHFRCEQPPVVRACLGEMCPHHEQDALGHSLEVTGFLQERFGAGASTGAGGGLPYLRLSMNGCSRNCLASGTDDIHIVAEATGYKIQVGGKASEIPSLGHFLCENITPEDLGEVLAGIIATFITERQDNETLFDLIERCGVSIFEAAVPSLNTHDESEQTDMSGDGDLGDVDWEHVEVETGSEDAPAQAPSDTMDPVFSASDLDDDTPLGLGNMDAQALTAMTLASRAEDGPEPPQDLISAASDILAEEEGLEAQEATEDDVSRITLSMRSESELEHAAEGMEASAMDPNPAADLLLPHALLTHAPEDFGAERPEGQAATASEASQADEETPASGDLAPSFLHLQERAAHAGALQVRIIEDVLSITTPEGLQLHLPTESLRGGLRVCLALGGDSLECWTRDEAIHLKLGPASVTIPMPRMAEPRADTEPLVAA